MLSYSVCLFVSFRMILILFVIGIYRLKEYYTKYTASGDFLLHFLIGTIGKKSCKFKN